MANGASKDQFDGVGFLNQFKGRGPYVSFIDEQLGQGTSYGEVVRDLFRERKRIVDLPQSSETSSSLEAVSEAIILANLGLVVRATSLALRTIYRFYQDHDLQRPVLDSDGAFALGLEQACSLMDSYDPDKEQGFYRYSFQAIVGHIFRETVLPNQMSVAKYLKAFIFFNEAAAVVSLKEEGKPVTDSTIGDELVRRFADTAAADETNPEIVQDAYRSLITPIRSLDEIHMRRNPQESWLDVDDEGDFPDVLPIDLEGSGDPQEREVRLFEDFNPADEEWQKKMWFMLEETGLLTLLSEQRQKLLATQLRINTEGENIGKFPTFRETGRQMGVSPQAANKMWSLILKRINVFLRITSGSSLD